MHPIGDPHGGTAYYVHPNAVGYDLLWMALVVAAIVLVVLLLSCSDSLREAPLWWWAREGRYEAATTPNPSSNPGAAAPALGADGAGAAPLQILRPSWCRTDSKYTTDAEMHTHLLRNMDVSNFFKKS